MAFFKKKISNTFTSIFAPLDGELIPLENVSDPVFSQKMMGEGIAILPYSDTVCAPMDGEIVLIANTKHAFGMSNTHGIEIMVHVGLDTMKLEGKGFKTLVEVGDIVKKGTPILSIDRAYMKDKKADLTTPIILLNHQVHPICFENTNRHVIANEHILFKVE